MNQRGFSESTQWVILTPVVMLMVLGIVQTGVWLYARTVASQAAAAAADVAAAGGADATAVAERIARSAGLSQLSVTSRVNGTQVIVTVAGNAALFFDLGQGRIAERAVLPMEQAR